MYHHHTHEENFDNLLYHYDMLSDIIIMSYMVWYFYNSFNHHSLNWWILIMTKDLHCYFHFANYFIMQPRQQHSTGKYLLFVFVYTIYTIKEIITWSGCLQERNWIISDYNFENNYRLVSFIIEGSMRHSLFLYEANLFFFWMFTTYLISINVIVLLKKNGQNQTLTSPKKNVMEKQCLYRKYRPSIRDIIYIVSMS